MGLEGVVSKRASAPYQPGRSKTWTKCKAKLYRRFRHRRATPPRRRPAGSGRWRWASGWTASSAIAARWGPGSTRRRSRISWRGCAPLEDRELAIAGAPQDIRWVRPVFSARIEYSNLTSDGSVRHGVFMGLRDVALTPQAAAERKRLISEADLATVWVTNPTRRLFGQVGADQARRRGLLRRDRRLHAAASLRAAGEPGALPDRQARGLLLPAAQVPRHAGGGGELRDADQRRGGPDLPDGGATPRAIWRWRSSGWWSSTPGAAWWRSWSGPTGSCSTSTRARGSPGARWWRRRCTCGGSWRRSGSTGFAKTTGGKGVHVVVPVTPKLDWKAVHAATGELAARIAATAPDTFTTVMGAPNRKRRIFIDFHRNARSATAVAPYSLRARNNLPASAPLSWEDLEKIDAPEDLNYSSLPGLVAATGDPWAEIERFRTRPSGAQAREGVRRRDGHGAEGILEGISEAEPGELPGAALSGDERERAGAVQPAAQGHPQPDQHEAGRPGARAGRAVGSGEGLRVRGQEVHHHRRRATSRRCGSSPTTR